MAQMGTAAGGFGGGFRRARFRAWALAVAVTAATVAASGAEDLVLGGTVYRVVAQARRESCNLALTLAPPGGAETAGGVDIAFGVAGPGDYARFRWDARGYVLETVAAGTGEVLRGGPDPFPADLAAGGRLELRVRPMLIEVIAGDRRLCRVVARGPGRGPAGVAVGPGQAQAGACTYQPIEPVTFGDDFMRTPEEASELGLWQPASGSWRLYSVMERIQANPDARIREGREPDAARSPNPFCMAGSGAEGAFILTGNAFWSDYEASVSVRSLQSDFGLVFAARDAGDCWLVRWGLHSLGLRPARLELVRRQGGSERTLASTAAVGRAEAWYRLGVRLWGDRITVLLDETPVLEHTDPGCTGGRIGLYARGSPETYFDDVTVRAVTPIRLETPGLFGPGVIRPLAGDWRIAAGEGGARFSGAGAAAPGPDGLALCALGWDEWPEQCLEAVVEAEPGAVFGVVFGARAADRHLRVLLHREEAGRGRLRVTRVTAGGAEDVAEAVCPLPAEGAVRLSAEASSGVLKVRTEGVTRLRVRVPDALAGPVGLAVLGASRATFRDITLFAEPGERWEQPVLIERFANDPFMQGWASTRYAWVAADPQADPAVYPRRLVHTGDFYGPFRVTAPVQDGLAFTFGLDDPAEGRGYRLQSRLDAGRREGVLVLTRDGAELARAAFTPGERSVLPGQQIVDEKIGARPRTPDTESYGTLELNRDGHAIWASLDGRELFCVHDPDPLEGRSLALEIPAPMDMIHVAAVRAQVHDELFEKAAVEWLPVGDWEVTNRFACDPRWSHMNGSSMGAAALWSKHAFSGDFTIECYAGMRMRQEEMMEGADRMYYPRVGDINLALATRSGDLFSGYNVILGAWDPMWTETFSQFRRLGEVVAQTDRELIPRVRRRQPRARAIPVEWDPGGRPVHGAWYFVKVRKTGPRYDVWFDHVPVFSVTDPDPLAVSRLALWTQHNSIVLARVKIGFRHSERVAEQAAPQAAPEGADARGLPAADAAPRLCSPSHPGYRFDMEGALHGFEPWNGDQSAEPGLEPRPEGGTALRLENLHAGGDAGVRFPVCGLDLGRSTVLEMDVAVEPETRVNLYLAFEDLPAERCFVPLTGPREEGPNMVRLGPGEGIPGDGRWHHVRWDLGVWARERFPWRESFRVRFLMIGMLHEGYLNAGLGGNPAGCVYRLDNVTLQAEGAADVAVECHAQSVEGLRWRAWLSRRPDDPPPDGLAEADAPCQRLRADAPGDWFVRAEWLRGGGSRPLAPLPIRVGRPLAVARTEPAPGEAWGGNRVTVFFAESGGHPDLAHCRLTVAGSPAPVNPVTTSYDPVSRRLDIRVRYGGDPLPDQSPVELVFESPDTLAGTAMPAADGQVTAPAPDVVCRWSARLDYGLDREGPLAALSRELVPRADFNGGLEGTVLLAPRTECRVECCPGPDGTPAMRLVNHVCGSAFSVRLPFPEFGWGKFARLAFDYRADSYAQADFLFRCLGQGLTLGFTDGDESGGLLMGSIPGVVRDDTWRHAEVDLTALRPRMLRRFAGPAPAITEVGFGDWVYPSNAPGAAVALDNVVLVPAVGTAAAPLEVAWLARDITGVRGYSYLWDASPDTEPDTVPETNEGTARLQGLPGGEVWFHIRACDGAGNWGPAAHGRFLVDNEPPVVAGVEPEPDSAAAAERLRVRFGPSLAPLDGSGLALAINGKSLPARGGPGVWDPVAAEFVYDLLADGTLLRGSVPDGATFTAALSGLRDTAGNAMAPLTWSWRVSYAADKTGPQPPRLWGYTQSFEYFDHFSGGPGAAWRPYGDPDQSETEVSGVTVPEAGPCLRVRKVGAGARFAVYRSLGQLSLDASPVLSFDYCMSPGTRANLMLLVQKEWRQITMTGSDRLPSLGRIPDAAADGRWRHAEIDLARCLREGAPDLEAGTLRLIAFGEWGVTNPPGSTLYLDNVAFLGPSCPLPLVRFTAADATGIRGYRLAFSQDPREEPASAGAVPGAGPALLAAADEPGLWYIHAQAQDGAGNWGETLHFPYRVDEPVARYSENGLEAGGTWRVVPQQRAPQGTLYRAQGSSGPNQVLGVEVVARPAGDIQIAREAALELPPATVFEADLYLHGDRPASVAACVRAAEGGGDPVVGERIEIRPGVWHRGVKLAFPPGVLDKAVSDATGKVRVREVGLVLSPGRGDRAVFLIDQVRIGSAAPAG